MAYSSEIKVFTGNSNRALAEAIVRRLGVKLGDAQVSAFADGEVCLSINETLRGADVFIIQSTCNHVNDNLMELLVMTDACRRASAGRITAVIPYFGYARQDRKDKARAPISAKLVANMITTAGADRVLTMDLHSAQIQGFFDIPLDNMFAGRMLSEHYINVFGKENPDYVVVSPDVGSVARARVFATRLGYGLAIVDKLRSEANKSEVMNIIGDVRDKNVIIFDDLVDTGGTLCGAAKSLKEDGGAKEIYACASHGVLSDPAIRRIEESPIKILRLVDTIPYPKNAPKCDKIQYISAAELFAEAIVRVHDETSISTLFR
ncbi:MAG: ribose-phosphate pyrophosphokinase [Oscillospiraceae bacterium]|jgi:ribose-phosphate pyrophosphokinase|nr:ribose-phosphate pyrophosphokinase [Oscillospiraceae bacterium]